VINTMRKKKVCKAAPIPGETKVWQYIALTRKLYMLDCPGIVPPTANDYENDCAKVLKGVVRPERIKDPSGYIDEVVNRVKKQYLLQRYRLPPDTTWENGEEFLSVLAYKMGKLFKGGEPDLEITARIVLQDWQRGRIPFFTPPPEEEGDDEEEAAPAAASSSSAAAPAEGDKAEDEDGAEKPVNTKEAIGQVRQSLAELQCGVIFDEEDRRGEQVAAEPETTQQRRDRKEAEAEDKKPAFLKSNRQKKRKAEVQEDDEDEDDDENDEEADGADEPAAASAASPKKKKKRRGGGMKKRMEASGSGLEKQGMTVKEGSMDWKAVVAEFDM